MKTSDLDLLVVHLEHDSTSAKEFRTSVSRPLREGVAALIKQLFGSPRPGGYVPRVTVRVAQFESVGSLTSALIADDDGGQYRPTELGRTVAWFILDYYLPPVNGAIGGTDASVVTHGVLGFYDMTFERWLHLFFPQCPVTLLTQGAATDVMTPQHWKYETKSALANPDAFVKRRLQELRDCWTPQFAAALEDFATQLGGDSMHTPGHNAGNAFRRSAIQRGFFDWYGPTAFTTDLSVSVDTLGDLSERPLGDGERRDFSMASPNPLRDAQTVSATIFGAADTFYVTNGTSTSNKAMLMAILRPGDVVLVDRNCHKSVHHAVTMAGALPVYLPPNFNEVLGVWAPLTLRTIERFLVNRTVQALNPKMLILTSCTYEGILYPVRDVADLCEAAGVLFFADEAWAPYLRFHPEYVRRNEADGRLRKYAALDGGAHFAVHSTHKALAAFSQASMIHVSHRFAELLESGSGSQWQWLWDRFSAADVPGYTRFRHELLEVLRYWHSTSPHYPMLASLDRAGVQMRIEGLQRLDDCLELARRMQLQFEEFEASVELSDIVGSENVGDFTAYHRDPLKVIVSFKNPECGMAFRAILRHDARVWWEKSTRGCIEFLVTIGTFNESIQHVLDAAKRHRHLLGRPDFDRAGHPDLLGSLSQQVAVAPRDAFHCLGELVTLERAAAESRVAAQMVVPYPPGIPVLLPGLRVTDAAVSLTGRALESEGAEHVHGILLFQGQPMVKVMTREEEQTATARYEGVLEALRSLDR